MRIPNNPVDLKKFAQVEQRIRAMLGKAFPKDDEGDPRVECYLVDKSRTRMPYIRPVPHGGYCDTLEDYLAQMDVVASNLHSAAHDFDTAWRCFEHYRRHLDDRQKLIAEFCRAVRPGQTPLLFEYEHQFLGEHPRDSRWLRPKEVSGVPGSKEGRLETTQSKEPGDVEKARSVYLRAAAKVLRSKFGRRITCWAVLNSSYGTTLYALVPYTAKELEQIRINQITRKRLWDAEQAKVKAEEAAKKTSLKKAGRVSALVRLEQIRKTDEKK